MQLMQFLTLLVFLYSVILALSVRKTNKESIVFISILYIALVLLAAFRDGSIMPDYEVYTLKYGFEVNGDGSDLEPSFKFISLLANLIAENNPYIMFLIYAILGVSIKFYAIRKLAPFFLFSIVIYISNFYILHELIQIRAGVATAIIMLALYPLYNRRFLHFSLLVLLASFFHYSALVSFVLLFIKPNSFSRIIWLLIIVAAFILFWLGDSIIGVLVQDFSAFSLLGKLEAYNDATRRATFAINPIGPYGLTRLIICLFFIFKHDIIVKYCKSFSYFLKIYILGFCVYVGFASFPDVAYRISMLFMVSEIFVIPMLIYTTKQRVEGKLLVVAFASLTIFLNVFYTSYFAY